MNPAIFNDFHNALNDLAIALGFPQKNDGVLAALIEDARVHSFLRCTLILDRLLESLAGDPDDPELKDLDDEQKRSLVFNTFVHNGILTKEQAIHLNNSKGYASFLVLHPSEIESEEEACIYKEAINLIPSLHDHMDIFLGNFYAKMNELMEERTDDCNCQ